MAKASAGRNACRGWAWGRTALHTEQSAHGRGECSPPGGLLLRAPQKARQVAALWRLDRRGATDARRTPAFPQRRLRLSASSLRGRGNDIRSCVRLMDTDC